MASFLTSRAQKYNKNRGFTKFSATQSAALYLLQHHNSLLLTGNWKSQKSSIVERLIASKFHNMPSLYIRPSGVKLRTFLQNKSFANAHTLSAGDITPESIRQLVKELGLPKLICVDPIDVLDIRTLQILDEALRYHSQGSSSFMANAFFVATYHTGFLRLPNRQVFEWLKKAEMCSFHLFEQRMSPGLRPLIDYLHADGVAPPLASLPALRDFQTIPRDAVIIYESVEQLSLALKEAHCKEYNIYTNKCLKKELHGSSCSSISLFEVPRSDNRETFTSHVNQWRKSQKAGTILKPGMVVDPLFPSTGAGEEEEGGKIVGFRLRTKTNENTEVMEAARLSFVEFMKSKRWEEMEVCVEEPWYLQPNCPMESNLLTIGTEVVLQTTINLDIPAGSVGTVVEFYTPKEGDDVMKVLDDGTFSETERKELDELDLIDAYFSEVPSPTFPVVKFAGETKIVIPLELFKKSISTSTGTYMVTRIHLPLLTSKSYSVQRLASENPAMLNLSKIAVPAPAFWSNVAMLAEVLKMALRSDTISFFPRDSWSLPKLEQVLQHQMEWLKACRDEEAILQTMNNFESPFQRGISYLRTH